VLRLPHEKAALKELYALNTDVGQTGKFINAEVIALIITETLALIGTLTFVLK